MKVVCMNCGALLRVEGNPEDGKVSHGICKIHEAYFHNQFKIWEATDELQNMWRPGGILEDGEKGIAL